MGVSKKIKKNYPLTTTRRENNFIDKLGGENWLQVKTIINVLREPILILDKNRKVVASNDSFYSTFQLEPKDTEEQAIYSLGNGQWNIPSLHKLLEEILPHNRFFKGYEITHTFPFIGRKVMILNARNISYKDDTGKSLDTLTVLAMEDITDMTVVAQTLADHAHTVNYKFSKETEKLQNYIGRLEKEVNVLKHRF